MQYNKEQLSGKDLAELQSIAEELGISQAQISRLEKNALKRIRKSL